jgi:hypothetical protein
VDSAKHSKSPLRRPSEILPKKVDMDSQEIKDITELLGNLNLNPKKPSPKKS